MVANEITISEEPADSDDVRWCFEQYYAELDRRFDAGFDVDAALPLDSEALTPPRGLVLVVRLHGAVVGCGAVKPRGRQTSTPMGISAA